MGLVYAVVSHWRWPIFGGGEQFLYDTMGWAKEMGFETIWLCFANADPKQTREFPETQMIQTPNGVVFQIAGGYTDESLREWLKRLRPRVVNHQGMQRIPIMRVCKEIGIPFITGLHFWHDAVDLDETTYNADILKNKARHKPSPNLSVIQEADVLYVASEFVQTVIATVANVTIPLVWHPVSPASRVVAADKGAKRETVTMINIHTLKGGRIFLHCIRNLHHVQFLGVRSEYMSDSLDEEIERAMAVRNASPKVYAPCHLLARTDNVKSVYEKTRILLIPSQVDETFCKVAQEGLANGLPIVASTKGYLGTMLKDAAVLIDSSEPEEWAKVLRSLYNNDKALQDLSLRALTRARSYSERDATTKFEKILKTATSTRARVMLYVPWADQGLGIQARNYVRFFIDIGVAPFVFSFRSYFTAQTEHKFQSSLEEWTIPNVPVYYSEHDREHVTDNEIVAFVKKHNVSHAVIPETCFSRVFEIAALLKDRGVWVYGIPNLETVRRSEVDKHRVFDLLLANNQVTLRAFHQLGFEPNNTMFLGYSVHGTAQHRASTKPSISTLRFLCVCGLNSVVRKQASKVCAAFLGALRRACPGISLTLTIQGFQVPDDLVTYSKISGFNVIQEHLSHKEIMDLYRTHHVVVHVSKHEGLGLGFFEAISTGTPVLTLDAPPYNEIVTEGCNEWLTKCHSTPMQDNDDGLITSVDFDPDDLTAKMLQVRREYRHEMVTRTIGDYQKRFSQKEFKKRWKRIFFLSCQ